MSTKTVHEGHNVKRIREIFGLKQEALALELGDDWNQRKVSLLETKKQIEPEILEQVAKALKVPVEAIKNFSEEAIVNNISCNFHDSPNSASVIYNFSQVDKLLEVFEENKTLYAALLKEKDEKITLLNKLLDNKK